MKIVLVNVKFSPNLGDGVIAECLEHALRQRIGEIEVVNCDLAGRTEYGADSGSVRSLALKLLPVAPGFIKKSAYVPMLELMVRRTLLPKYDEIINGADVAIFGGGQILADADLNFPMKIAAASSIIRDRNMPTVIHGVGVGEEWSDTGAALFKEAFAGADIIWTSVRDELSQQRWHRHFRRTDLPEPHISLDPGLIASRLYKIDEAEEAPRRNRPLIGFGVTAPSTLRAHFDGGARAPAYPDGEFIQGVVRALCNADYDVLLFTNGAPDDEAFLHGGFPPSFMNSFDADQVRIAPRSATPKELAALIRQCDCIVSHRLHACIVAYSYRVPSVGLTLNRKLDSFFDSVGRRDFLLGPEAVAPGDVAEAVRRASETPIPESAHAETLDRVERDLDALAATLSVYARHSQRRLAQY